MRINQNISAMNTYSRLTSANTAKSNSLAKLSSGLRINKAGDDAAGLAISEKMRGQISGLNQAAKNAQDGISLIQTAEGALSETHSILQRMRELAVQSANGTNTGADRTEIQKEMNQLTSEINRVGNTTEFNTQKLLKGAISTGSTGAPSTLAVDGITITADSNDDAYNGYTVTVVDNTTEGIAVDHDLSTITMTLDLSNTPTLDLSGFTPTVSGTNPGGTGAFTFTGTFGTAPTAGNIGSTASGADDIAGGVVSDFTAQLQIGANSGQSFDVSIEDMRSAALGLSNANKTDAKTVIVDGKTYNVAWTAAADVDNAGSAEYALDVSSFDNSTAAIGVLDQAIADVSSQRSQLGAYQNRLDHTINNLTTTSENLTAAESRIRDVDMAEEMMEFTKNNILSQAATSMLAQANQMPQSVLQLLQ